MPEQRCGDAAISLNGKEYPYSIEDCNDGSAGESNHYEFNLGRQCTTFNAAFGLDDSSDPNTPVALTVGAHSSSLFSATEQLGEETPAMIDITNHLRLSVSYVETADHPNNENGVHPDFSNPRVFCSF